MDPNTATPTASAASACANPTAGVTIIISSYPPPFPAAPRSIDFGPLKLILGILALITIPALIYAAFFATPCFSNSDSRRRRGISGDTSDDLPATAMTDSAPTLSPSAAEYGDPEAAPPPFFSKGENCAVCLSELGNGDDVRVLSACNHAFHAACVDKWLSSTPNCPICRVAASPPRQFVETIANNYRFNLPDYASNMV